MLQLVLLARSLTRKKSKPLSHTQKAVHMIIYVSRMGRFYP